jgi:hypothetical protein
MTPLIELLSSTDINGRSKTGHAYLQRRVHSRPGKGSKLEPEAQRTRLLNKPSRYNGSRQPRAVKHAVALLREQLRSKLELGISLSLTPSPILLPLLFLIKPQITWNSLKWKVVDSRMMLL